MTQVQVIEAIRSKLLTAAAAAGIPATNVVYDNVPAPTAAKKWLQLTVLPQTRNQISSGGATVQYRTTGTAVVNIFTELEKGDKDGIAVGDAILAAFTGWKNATPDITATPAPTFVGAARRDEAGSWWIRTVEIRWRHDEGVARQ